MAKRKALTIDLPLASWVDPIDGTVFQTGVPLAFSYARNVSGSSPNMGTLYQQHIEPAGRYMIYVPARMRFPLPGVEYGVVTFRAPLVMLLTTTPEEIYGDGSWKARLFALFKAKKAALSKKIVSAGFDGIVTIHPKHGEPSETVDLTMFRG